MTNHRTVRDETVSPLLASMKKTFYLRWMQREGIPIHEGYGIEDVRQLELAPWTRTGGKGAFIVLYGMEGMTGMYTAEIPPGGALEPERHLYEEVICILSGYGATEVWTDGGKKRVFEWGPFSVFAPPLNLNHRLVNGGREPVKFLAVTNAPLMMDVLHNEEFIFNCPFWFSDRYRGEEDYFSVGQKRYEEGMQHVWETNFIPDVRSVSVDAREVKGAGVQITQFELSGNGLIGHIAQWPAGSYQKAHYHGPGAVLFGLQSSGYVLLWNKELGIQPYQSGHGDKVIEVQWKEGSLYCPPGGWFHQHFNTGPEPARHMAIRFGSRRHPFGFHNATKREADGVYIEINKGGTLIPYEDEDPEIRRRYERELKAQGVPCRVPPVSRNWGGER